METLAVVFEAPERLALRVLPLRPGGGRDDWAADTLTVAVDWSGISTGTERLLFTGRMPPFPGLGYPLVPGYEAVGRVIRPDDSSLFAEGDAVFIPGAHCFGDVRGLFGGAAARLKVPASRVARVEGAYGPENVLLALAATAEHALHDGSLPDLIIGHGVLGRLLARLTVASGGSPTVWEKNPNRRGGAVGYCVNDPQQDPARDFRSVYDASGDSSILDAIIPKLARRGEITLVGFYSERMSFSFPPAFMKEARLRVAAEWQPEDLQRVQALIGEGKLDLTALITHRSSYENAADAYRTAFTDPECLKMVVDWREAK